MQGEEALWEDYNNVAVLSQSLMLLKWMCAITEVLEGLAHCPRMRFSYKPKMGLVPDNQAAVQCQSASRSIPGMEGSGSRAESRQLQWFKMLPHSCVSRSQWEAAREQG